MGKNLINIMAPLGILEFKLSVIGEDVIKNNESSNFVKPLIG
ncbi:hypothetical protein CBF_0397 [Clostridium botulinum F str. 230613]|nr:hypothetical protein CBF_0397 [Clostridium botulinum F str. 230613]